MKRPSTFALLARGLFGAGQALFSTLRSPRTLAGIRYSFYKYPLSTAFLSVSSPRMGTPLPGGACIVYHVGYGAALYGLEGFSILDTHRYARIYEQLVEDGVVDPKAIYVPEAVTDRDLIRIHDPAYLKRLDDPKTLADAMEMPVIAYLPKTALERVISTFRLAAGGTLLAARLAMETGLGINLGGGFHHARPRSGGGFCMIADIPAAIQALRAQMNALRVLVVDLDVHQGDGTIICTEDDPRTFTFSMHQEDIFPFPKEDGDLDIALPAGTGDAEYLDVLRGALPVVFEQSRPDLVFYIAGADPLASDPLASIELSETGLIERDRMVSHACASRGIPLVVTLGGGYGPEAWSAQYKSMRRLATDRPIP